MVIIAEYTAHEYRCDNQRRASDCILLLESDPAVDFGQIRPTNQTNAANGLHQAFAEFALFVGSSA